jgi:hypothetical protein
VTRLPRIPKTSTFLKLLLPPRPTGVALEGPALELGLAQVSPELRV